MAPPESSRSGGPSSLHLDDFPVLWRWSTQRPARSGSSGGKGCGGSGATSGMKGGIGGGSGSGKGGSGGDRGGVGGGGDGENMDGFALCRKYRGHSILVQGVRNLRVRMSHS